MDTKEKKIKVLIVEDEQLIALTIKEVLEKKGFQITDIVDSFDQAISSVEEFSPDVALVDIQIRGDKDGVDITKELQNQYKIPAVVLTAHSDTATVQNVESVSPYGYLIKPFNHNELYALLLSAHEQYKMKRVLESNLGQMQNLLYKYDKGLIITDEHGFITFANSRATEFLPDISTSLLNRRFTEIFRLKQCDQTQIESFSHLVESYSKEHSLYRHETDLDSAINWIQLEIQLVQDDHNPARYILILEDKDADLDKEEQLRLLSEATAQTDEAILITGSELEKPGPEIVYVNEAFCRMSQYSREELIGNTPRLLQGPETDREMLDELKSSLKKGQSYSASTINYKKDGTPYRVRWRISPVRDTNGEITHWVSVQRDITDSYQMRQRLVNSEAQLRALLNSDTQFTVLLSKDQKILDFNTSAQKLLKSYGSKELDIGVPFLDLLDKKHQKLFKHDFEKVLNGEIIKEERKYYSHDGAHRWFLNTIYPVQNGEGDILGICLKAEDIHAKKEFELKLQKTEKKLQSLLRNSSDLITVIDVNHQITFVGGSSDKILGISYENLKQKSLVDYIHPEDRDSFISTLELITKNPDETPFLEIRLKDSNGNYRIFQTVFNNQLQDEQLRGFILNSRDVTEVRKTEEALELSKERFTSLTERLPDGYYKSTTDGRLTHVNPAFVEMLGYSSKDELISRNIENGLYYVPEEREQVLKYMSKNDSGRYKFRLRRADGEIIWVEEHGQPIYDANGNISHYEGVIRDITEQKKTEDVLRGIAEGVSSKSRYNHFQNLVMQLKKAIDVDYIRLLEVLPNDPTKVQALAYSGTDQIEDGEPFAIEDDLCKEIFDNNEIFVENQAQNDKISECIKKLNIQSCAGIRLSNGKGESIGALLAMNKQPMRRKDFVMSVLRISGTNAANELERIRHQQQLVEAKEKAEEMNRLKSSFLANISHEIRTPMNSIMGFASLLEEETDPETQKQFISKIHGSGNRLLNTIDSLLNLAKIEANKVDLNLKQTNIGDEVKAATHLLGGLAARKNLKLTTDIQCTDGYIEIDEDVFSIILNNLVGNAIKFTEEGEVRVEVSCDKQQACIKVSDTGIGISKDFLPNLFEEFNQESSGLNRKFEGTGLGLTITRRYVELLNGTIDVESEKGVGTTFTIHLPLTEPKTENREEKPSTENQNSPSKEVTKIPGNPRILLVEDHLENQEIFKLFLKKDFEIDSASYNEEALKLASKNTYDLFLIDINLAYGDSGSDLLVELKKLNQYEDTPAIAVTAYAMKEDEQRFRDEGFSDYVSKPFTKKKLKETIVANLDRKHVDTTPVESRN